MPAAPPFLQPKLPDWRHFSHFLLIALALHGAVLFYPMPGRIEPVEIPPPNTLSVRLVDAIPALPPTLQAAPQPLAPAPSRERRAPSPRPVLAMAPEQISPAPTFSVPAPLVAPPATPLPPLASPAPVVAAAVIAARFDAAYLHNPEPRYPSSSRHLGEEGKVLLKVRVTPAGQAAVVDIEKSSNFERLDEAARQAVARWRFVPARRGEEAIEATVIVPIVFRLE